MYNLIIDFHRCIDTNYTLVIKFSDNLIYAVLSESVAYITELLLLTKYNEYCSIWDNTPTTHSTKESFKKLFFLTKSANF